MERLPVIATTSNPTGITSIQLSPELRKLVEMEKIRCGHKSMGETIRLILEEYFKEDE